MIRHRIAALAAVTAVLALGACGTTEDPKKAAEEKPSGGPVTVTDSRGKQVKLDAPARTVVALEWGEAEMLASLGVMPAGVADAKGFATWVTAEKLDDGVKDVGKRGEPSTDSILGLEPDLVVMEDDSSGPLIKQLEEYDVPVLVTTGADAAGGDLDRMRADLTMIAKAVGKDAEAGELLGEFDAKLAAAKAELVEAGVKNAPFVMMDGFKDGNAISIRPFGQGALVSRVAEKLGLRNVWRGKVDKMWGLGQTDVEGLTTIKEPDVKFLYNASDGNDVFAGGLDRNPIWRSLPFVEKDNVHKLTDGIWTFGGPKSCAQYADELVKVFTG